MTFYCIFASHWPQLLLKAQRKNLVVLHWWRTSDEPLIINVLYRRLLRIQVHALALKIFTRKLSGLMRIGYADSAYLDEWAFVAIEENFAGVVSHARIGLSLLLIQVESDNEVISRNKS